MSGASPGHPRLPNLPLAARLALRSMRLRPVLSLATTLGVALGMMVVGSILIVDHNSREVEAQTKNLGEAIASLAPSAGGEALKLSVRFERRAASQAPGIVPTQVGGAPETVPFAGTEGSASGEEDYQAMRLAVRLASLLTFGIGAVIVFFTLRFSVAARAREFSLLLCLGEQRAGVALSLVVQAACFGVVGSAVGLLLAFPVARALLRLGISTTGRMPMSGFSLPWLELGAMFVVSLAISLCGVIGPVLSLYRMRVVDILQPRFLSPDVDARNFRVSGFGWLVPALLAAAYLSFRPFLRSWLTVVEFFAVEVAVVGLLAAVSLWAMPPILRLTIALLEKVLAPTHRLEALLVARRMRLTSQKQVFTIASVALVFSLLIALHTVTHALKQEIAGWAAIATAPYTYFVRDPEAPPGAEDASAFRARLANAGVQVFRLSAELPGEFPLRLIAAEDLNPVRRAQGRPPLLPGSVILSTTLAARFGVEAGDQLIIEGAGGPNGAAGESRFDILEVADDVGCYVERGGPYIDLKSFALMSDGNRLFADNLERSLGHFAMARNADPGQGTLSRAQRALFEGFYLRTESGRAQGWKRTIEIDRDFLIFDFILAMTVLLAAIGIANNMLIQVDARQREFSVLRTIGIRTRDVTRLLLVEGGVIGVVGAGLATVLGLAIGALSVSFLDRFTLFHYVFGTSEWALALIILLAIATCTVSAFYPARVAANRSSAESLHYE